MEGTFGSRLGQFRLTTSYNQEEFGKKIGLARTTISNVENDKYIINAQTLTILIKEFPKLNIIWLLTGDGNMFKSSSSDDDRIDLMQALIKEKDARIKTLEELLNKYR